LIVRTTAKQDRDEQDVAGPLRLPRGAQHSGDGALFGVLVVAVWWSCAPVAVTAQPENPAEIIAAQIRMQGVQCEKPTSAQHARELSKPNQQVWVLRCANATYRVKLTPDLAAQVERLD
jgi:hypothetical protein